MGVRRGLTGQEDWTTRSDQQVLVAQRCSPWLACTHSVSDSRHTPCVQVSVLANQLDTHHARLLLAREGVAVACPEAPTAVVHHSYGVHAAGVITGGELGSYGLPPNKTLRFRGGCALCTPWALI